MTDSLVLLEKNNGIALVTLNRPDALNALSIDMRSAIVKVFDELKEDDDVHAVVLTGAGRAFCAGLDLKELGSGGKDNLEAVSGANLQRAVVGCGKPVIGAVNGFAITGGFELALMTDFIIASEKAQFADTHSQVGIVPGWALSQKLPRLIGINRAKEVSLTGNFLDAHTAERWGLVNRVVSSEELVPTCLSLAEDIASADQRTLKTVKRIMDEGWNTTLDEGLAIEREASSEHMKGVTAEFLEARRLIVVERGRKKRHKE